MPSHRLVFRILRALYKMTPVNYNKDMPNKITESPDDFKFIKRLYDTAVLERQEEIRRMFFKEKKSQQEIAEYFEMDVAQVNRFIQRIKKEMEE